MNIQIQSVLFFAAFTDPIVTFIRYYFKRNYSVPQAEHERRPLERNTSESEATEQLQNLYKLEIILNDQENFGKHIDFFSCLFYPFSVLGERMLRL